MFITEIGDPQARASQNMKKLCVFFENQLEFGVVRTEEEGARREEGGRGRGQRGRERTKGVSDLESHNHHHHDHSPRCIICSHHHWPRARDHPPGPSWHQGCEEVTRWARDARAVCDLPVVRQTSRPLGRTTYLKPGRLDAALPLGGSRGGRDAHETAVRVSMRLQKATPPTYPVPTRRL